MVTYNFYKGTSASQDYRFPDADAKLKKKLKFDPILKVKVDIDLVNLDYIKPWIEKKCRHLLTFTDDILETFIFEQIKDKTHPHQIQMHMNSYFGKEPASLFINQLWCLLISSSKSKDMLPDSLLWAEVNDLTINSFSTEKFLPTKEGQQRERS